MSSTFTTILDGGERDSGERRAPTTPARIAGRYVVEEELGAGGMGSVYRVVDESSGQALALKRLKENSGSVGALLFRKEYHTLALLRHPRIIGVYDYGIDDGVPYYTMDLLDGADLRALAPVPYFEACQYLRDVASSLALLHAHRLVYRDLTPRNVRATQDGRCKLIDFGALAPFGTPPVLVGTAPFVSPEALRRVDLDQRSDLFSLGALAYFLLTGTNAFDVPSLSDLEKAWSRRPKRPSEILSQTANEAAALEPIPRTLDALVMSLLSIDPLARPTSAAEVIDRLDAIAVLRADEGTTAEQSYLQSAQLVGRGREIDHARELAEKAAHGIGGVLVVNHATGMGGTRLLKEVGVEYRLNGATVLEVDGAVERGPYAVARALVAKLVTALPDLARRTADTDVYDLGWVRFSASDRVRMRSRVDATVSPGAWRVKVQAALQTWFERVAGEQPLALLVDNFQAVDEGSAALLALLGASASNRSLLVTVAVRTGEAVQAKAPLRALSRMGRTLTLGPLCSADSFALVQSLFGDVPNSERWSQWLHRLSGGHPLHIMELSRYVVSHHVARYIEGTWVLPRDLPAELPSQIEEVLDDRLSNLSALALGLASAFSLHEGPLSLEVAIAMVQAGGDEPFAVLDELVSQGIVVGYDRSYRLAQEVLRERLRSRLAEEDRKHIHRKLGERLLESSGSDVALTLNAGWHLFHGGEEERGADILRRVGLELVRADDLAEAVPALEAAVKVYKRLGRPRHELLGLVEPLAFGGYYVDRRLADRYGDETLELLAEETGLALTRRLSPYLGRYLSLLCGLIYAFVLHFFSGRGGPAMLSHRIAILGGISSSLTGTATLCLDREGALRRAAVFEPFSVLPRRHAGAFSYALAQLLVQLTEDRTAETVAGLRRLRDQLEARFGVVDLPESLRPVVKGGVLFALGVLESLMDGPLALERAAELEGCGLRLYDMVACQVRAHYHACRGEADLAREYERKVDIYAIRSGTAWQAEVWAPTARLVAFSLTGDIIGLKRAAEELERLALEIPSLSRYAKHARGLLAVLRGEHESAIALLRELLEEPGVEPRSRLGWTACVGSLARVYNEIGEHEQSRALCAQALERMTEADRVVVATNLVVEIQHALALSGLGRIDEASRLLDDLIAKHQENRGPVTMGSLHEARATIAHQMGDAASFEYHRARVEEWFRPTKNPALVARCERINSLGARTSEPPEPSNQPNDLVTTCDDPRAMLAACSSPRDRARRALELALSEYESKSGFLFGVRNSVLVPYAACPEDQEPTDEMLATVQKRFCDALEEEASARTEIRNEETSPEYSIVVLSVDEESRGARRGVGVLAVGKPNALPAPRLEPFAKRLARALYEFGDVSTMQVVGSPAINRVQGGREPMTPGDAVTGRQTRARQ